MQSLDNLIINCLEHYKPLDWCSGEYWLPENSNSSGHNKSEESNSPKVILTKKSKKAMRIQYLLANKNSSETITVKFKHSSAIWIGISVRHFTQFLSGFLADS